jgi:hypothetical protein
MELILNIFVYGVILISFWILTLVIINMIERYFIADGSEYLSNIFVYVTIILPINIISFFVIFIIGFIGLIIMILILLYDIIKEKVYK